MTIRGKHMKRFKLIGRLTVFTVTGFYTVLGDVECVVGVAEINGSWFRTQARICDVEEVE